MAPVGQAGMHALQCPHPRRDGVSTGRVDGHGDAGEHHVRARRRRDERGVLAGEADAGPLRDRTIERPAVVDEPLGAEDVDPAAQPVDEGVTPPGEEVVVVDGAIRVRDARVRSEASAYRGLVLRDPALPGSARSPAGTATRAR